MGIGCGVVANLDYPPSEDEEGKPTKPSPIAAGYTITTPISIRLSQDSGAKNTRKPAGEIGSIYVFSYSIYGGSGPRPIIIRTDPSEWILRALKMDLENSGYSVSVDEATAPTHGIGVSVELTMLTENGSTDLWGVKYTAAVSFGATVTLDGKRFTYFGCYGSRAAHSTQVFWFFGGTDLPLALSLMDAVAQFRMKFDETLSALFTCLQCGGIHDMSGTCPSCSQELVPLPRSSLAPVRAAASTPAPGERREIWERQP
jgi:hypothetical protein